MNNRFMLTCVVVASFVISARAAETPVKDPGAQDQMELQLKKAQERLDQAAREVADLSVKLSNEAVSDMHSWMRHGSPRAILGINIDSAASSPPQAVGGVQIVSVSPGGPADIAGLKAKDVIVSFNAHALHADAGHSPPQMLSALMSDAKATEPATLEYKRDGILHKTTIVPKAYPEFFSEEAAHELRGLDAKLSHLDVTMRLRDSSGLGSAELLELTPSLGKYFGTDKGLLVVRAPADSRLALQDGDVILDIDGRVPTSAAHALQILNSYRAGEKLKLHIVRQQKQLELPIEIPSELPRSNES
jgi:S1-C subfamily serine protease